MLYLTPEDAALIKSKIAGKETGMSDLGQKLGDAMSRSGSFPASSPEYAAVHLEMKNLQNSLDYLKGVLAKYAVVGAEKADTKVISTYSVVTLQNKDTDEKICYYITLSDLEKQIDSSYLIASPESPVGKALIGHKLNDEITITLPIGTKRYLIASHDKRY